MNNRPLRSLIECDHSDFRRAAFKLENWEEVNLGEGVIACLWSAFYILAIVYSITVVNPDSTAAVIASTDGAPEVPFNQGLVDAF
jgi:hypothetical protein